MNIYLRASTGVPAAAVNASEEEEDENEFYDAIAEGGSTPNSGADGRFTLNIPTGHTHRRNSSGSSSETDEIQDTQQVRAHFVASVVLFTTYECVLLY